MVLRAAAFAVLWIVLSAGDPPDFAAGFVAILAATWVSLRLWPPGAGRVRPAALAGLAVHLLRQSVVAGADIAWRALDPKLPLRPGFVRFAGSLPPGSRGTMFTTLMSLLPGTVPAGPARTGGLLIHCLDVAQPVARQLAAEEARFARAIAEADGDG
jgi:multicomponent Na+:H+ antiporter subunit E